MNEEEMKIEEEDGDVMGMVKMKVFIDLSKINGVVTDAKTATPGNPGVILLAVVEKPFEQETQYLRLHRSLAAIGVPVNAVRAREAIDTRRI
ncbi:hypothetical protein BDW62DRAFT_206401 [Aspergillus aurantiobrunneus]